MASRRARLKAVANLPVRRKAGESQDAAEAPTIVPEDNIVPDVKTEQHSKESVPESAPPPVAGAFVSELEKISEPEKPDEQIVEEKKEIQKDEKKTSGPAKFNRRVKPIVNLPVRKERVQGNNSENNSINKTETETQKITDTDNVNNEISSPESNVPEKTNLDSNEPPAPVNIVITEKQPEKIVVPQSPVKATQRPVFLRPNVDLNIRRQNDDLRNLTLSPRVRNISECSNTSVIVQNVNTAQNDLVGNMIGKTNTSIVKRKRPKSNDLSRKMADARREFHRRYEKIKPDRSSLRMIDLIFYNPTTNPMISKTKSENKKEDQSEEEILAEEKVDDPCGLDSSKTDDDMDDENLTKMPVPQVKIGLNGEIILDEKSLVIETTDAKKGREDLQNSVPVFEDRSTKISYYCRKNKKSKDWTDSETKRFYKALNTLGTDFLLMQQLFPNRDRVELKNKFKREEKLNRNLIDKALNNPSEFDMTQLEKDLEDEKRIEEEETELKLQKRMKPKTIENKNRTKSTLLSKEMVESDSEITFETSPDDPPSQIVTRKTTQTEEKKKIKEVDMLYEKLILKSKGNKLKTEAIPVAGDQNENLPMYDDFNKTDFKSHRRKSVHEPIEEDNAEALDLTVNKKPIRKRKLEKIGRKKKKKRKKATMVYPPDVEEPETKEDVVVTRTITDEDFYQLLAANMKNMKDSNIKVQVTKDIAPGSKKIEIILDEVPPITLKEIEDQNVTVLADCNTTICEDESPKSPEENDNNYVSNETSVIVKNPNASKKTEDDKEDSVKEIENENVMLVIDETDQAEYQYIMVEQEVEPIEVEIPAEEIEQNVDVETETEKIISPAPSATSPSLVVCKNPQTETEKMYLAGLSAGSFVLMASDAADQSNEKKLSMFMISEKAQSDGSSVLSSMPVMLPPELLNSLTQELDCS